MACQSAVISSLDLGHFNFGLMMDRKMGSGAAASPPTCVVVVVVTDVVLWLLNMGNCMGCFVLSC